MKLGEQVGHRALDLLIGVLDDAAVAVVDQPDRQRMAQLAAVGRGQLRPVQPPQQEMEFYFRHLPLKAKQDPVVDVGQVVDTVGVDEQRVGQPGQFHQPGQVGVGAPEAGDFQAEHRADLAHTQLGHDLPVAVALGAEPARHPEVGVDHDDLLGQPPQFGGGADQAVLPVGRLGVEPHLRHRRLPYVHHRQPRQVRAGDLRCRVHRPRSHVAATRPCSPPPPPPADCPEWTSTFVSCPRLSVPPLGAAATSVPRSLRPGLIASTSARAALRPSTVSRSADAGTPRSVHS
jgi:hypothetical protein